MPDGIALYCQKQIKHVKIQGFLLSYFLQQRCKKQGEADCKPCNKAMASACVLQKEAKKREKAEKSAKKVAKRRRGARACAWRCKNTIVLYSHFYKKYQFTMDFFVVLFFISKFELYGACCPLLCGRFPTTGAWWPVHCRLCGGRYGREKADYAERAGRPLPVGASAAACGNFSARQRCGGRPMAAATRHLVGQVKIHILCGIFLKLIK